jgi:hypothetical protein
VDVFTTRLAYPKATFLNAAKGRASVSKLLKFTIEVTNRECALRSGLYLLPLIGAWFNRDPVVVAGETPEFSNLVS